MPLHHSATALVVYSFCNHLLVPIRLLDHHNSVRWTIDSGSDLLVVVVLATLVAIRGVRVRVELITSSKAKRGL